MMPRTTATLSLLLLVFPVERSAGEEKPTAAAAAECRALVLPLVAKAGKQKALFSEFKAGEPAKWNANFWGAPLGFTAYTAIGWHQAQAGTLVTPEHVVSAGHYGFNAKGVDFYGLDGRYLGNRKALRNAEGKPILTKISPDILVLRLESPAPEGAAISKLPDPAGYETRKAWNDLEPSQRPLLIATDWRNPRPTPPAKEGEKQRQRWRITRTAQPVLFRQVHEAARLLLWSYGANGDPQVDPSYHETVNKGDSSHPVFWVTKSGLVLASHFSSTGSGPDYGHPAVQESLQAAVDKLGGSKEHRLTFAPVP